MEPRLHTGDLVFAEAQSSYAIGDVVVYRVPAGEQGAGAQIVHRIVGGDPVHGFVIQGDNKPAPDPWRPKLGDIVGHSWLELPGSGRLLQIIRQPLVIASFLGGIAFLWILTFGDERPDQKTAGRWRDRIARWLPRGRPGARREAQP